MKLFYNDRYSAAYMSVHHGLRFIDDNGLAAPYIVVQDNTVRDGERFYIDPEQHHLFKAQAGDIIAFPPCDYDGEIYCQQVFKHPDGGVCIWSDQLRYHSIESDYEIIMRDGKHFFMPEVEQ